MVGAGKISHWPRKEARVIYLSMGDDNGNCGQRTQSIVPSG